MEDKKEFYMGIDIESGSPLSKENHKFTAIILDKDLKMVNKINSISLSSLIRLAWEWKPKSIATDNVFEIVPDEKSLSKFLSLLPPQTDLIQVTINEGKFVELKEVAKQLNLEVDQTKLSPSKTAYLAAVIASKGKGVKIGFSNEKTQIIVSKGRWSRSGGMSQGRYQRRIRASVNIAANKIKESLEKAGIDYDMFVRKGDGGIDSAVFTVYAPRERLFGIVKPHKGIDYIISIKSVYDGKILFGNNNEKPEKPIIVGIDPGITAGIAIIDLNGNILYLGSKKEMDRGDIISLIYSFGKPILIAVDVDIIPDMVKKLAGQINAEIYVPHEDMLVADKSDLALKATGGNNPDTTHERDALAAAYKAYLNYKSKLSQVESYVEKIDIDLDIEKIKADVIRGVTIAEAIEKQINEMLNINENYKEQINNNCNNDNQNFNELIYKMQKLEAEKIILENKLNEMKKSLSMAENEIRIAKQNLKAELLKDEEIKKLKGDVLRLNSLINDIETNLNVANEKNNIFKNLLMKILNNEIIILKRLQYLKISNIKKVEEIYGKIKEGDILLIEDQGSFENEALNYIERSKVYGVLLSREDTSLSELLTKKGIVVLNKNKYNIFDIDIFTFGPSTILNDIKVKEKEIRKVKEDSVNLKNIIEQYRKNKI